MLCRLGLLQGNTDAVGKVSVYNTESDFASQNRIRLGLAAPLLRGIHNENDLLITLCLSENSISELAAPHFAGICAGFLGDKRIGRLPITESKLFTAWKRVETNYWYLHELEAKHNIELTTEPNASGVQLFALWAAGENLAKVLKLGGVEVGDFIGSARRLIDLLGQLSRVGNNTWIGMRADEAIRLVRRWEWL
ncbi:hypothetical protein RQN30_01070 [Arcanobacterium hippocoleae]